MCVIYMKCCMQYKKCCLQCRQIRSTNVCIQMYLYKCMSNTMGDRLVKCRILYTCECVCACVCCAYCVLNQKHKFLIYLRSRLIELKLQNLYDDDDDDSELYPNEIHYASHIYIVPLRIIIFCLITYTNTKAIEMLRLELDFFMLLLLLRLPLLYYENCWVQNLECYDSLFL